MVQLSDKRYVVVTAKRAKRNAPAQPTSFYNASNAILTGDVLPLSSPVSIPFSPCSSSYLSPPLSPCVDRSWTKQKFLADTNSVYCYVYQGAFLPSGSSDGFKWKSSCNVSSQGVCQHTRRRRRVMWSDEAPGMCAIEFRHCSHCGNTESEKLMSPEDIDWTEIMDHICKKGNRRLLQTMEELSAQFELMTRRDPPPVVDEPAHVLSYVNGILDNWAIQYHSNGHLIRFFRLVVKWCIEKACLYRLGRNHCILKDSSLCLTEAEANEGMWTSGNLYTPPACLLNHKVVRQALLLLVTITALYNKYKLRHKVPGCQGWLGCFYNRSNVFTFQRPRTGNVATPTSAHIFLIPTLFQILGPYSTVLSPYRSRPFAVGHNSSHPQDLVRIFSPIIATSNSLKMPYTATHPNRGLLNGLIQQHRTNGYDITFRGKAAPRILTDTTVEDATIDVWYAAAQANTDADWEGLRDAIVPPPAQTNPAVSPGPLWGSTGLSGSSSHSGGPECRFGCVLQLKDFWLRKYQTELINRS
ncbi:hypothetical protein PROFUN_13561 [Planoprotostelium fungivorum]|uniref:Uncharacterized protein n=1 Tax=Planoprotostelium fungivorum TaxID=1890364 RepID=A0A2P6N3F8_9EUKA|nr:hypothetical protein PROFUN_13561 [Planoprotostelium fungivorum]